MATSSSKRSQFWRADWFVGVLVLLAVLALHGASDFFGTLERRYYDFSSTSTSTSRQPSDRIAIIAIDDQSIANIGRRPWPRDVHAQLIDQLAAAKAKTIAHTAFFFEPQTDRGLAFIRRIKEALGSAADPAAASHAAPAFVQGGEKTLVFATGENPAFAKTMAALAPLDAPAGRADTDLKP